MTTESSMNQDDDHEQREHRGRIFNAVIERDRLSLTALLALDPLRKYSDGDLLGACARIGWSEGIELLAPFCDVPNSRALSSCAGRGDLESVKTLLAFFDPADDRSEAIDLAAERGSFECLRLLLSCPLPERSGRPIAALRGAASEGHANCVELLLPFCSGPEFDPVAMQLAADNGHVECVKLLLPLSNASDSDFRALRSAALMGHAECVELLLAARPIPLDPPLEFPSPSDILSCAIESGCVDTLSVVLRDPEFRAQCDLPFFAKCASTDPAQQSVAAFLAAIMESEELSSISPSAVFKSPPARL